LRDEKEDVGEKPLDDDRLESADEERIGEIRCSNAGSGAREVLADEAR
jgi:hypothetical protein